VPDPAPRHIVHIDPDLLPLIPDFLAHRRADVTAVRAALARADYDAIRVVGHNLRGCGAGYGFAAITDVGTDLERAAKSGDAGEMRRCVDALAAYLEHVEVVEAPTRS
jgi:HPt (histidine-containing phosphotransfer) domain-containing protein